MYWIAAVLALALVVATFVLTARIRRAEREVVRLSRHLDSFADASVRVADSLDALLRGEVTPVTRVQGSRRYLLNQARDQIATGEQLQSVAQRLGLSRDEMLLLGRASQQAA